MDLSLHRGPLITEWNLCLGGRLVYRELRKMDEGGLLYCGNLRYVKQGSEMGVYFHRGPTFGEHGWAFLSWGLLIRGIFVRSFRDMQMPCRRVSLSIGALLGNLEGVLLLELLREKKYYIWVSFLDPEVIKVLSLGATAPTIRYGARRARLLRPRCIGAERPGTNC